MKNNNKIVTEAEPKFVSRMDCVKLLHANACIVDEVCTLLPPEKQFRVGDALHNKAVASASDTSCLLNGSENDHPPARGADASDC